MKFPFRMAENSLFAILLRSSWWVSALVALGVFAAVRLFIPEGYAAFVPLPFVVISAMAAWRQFNTPGPAKVAARLEELRAMSWDGFSAVIEDAWRRAGYEVTRTAGGVADFELVRDGRLTLAACRRWKAARTGAEPLKELLALRAARDAAACIHVAAGEVTDTAQAYARENGVVLLQGLELVRLLP